MLTENIALGKIFLKIIFSKDFDTNSWTKLKKLIFLRDVLIPPFYAVIVGW